MARQVDVVGIDESEVRRLCGDGDFARGDALERAGHVLFPEIRAEVLRGEVLGTWRRRDHVEVQGINGRLGSECSCGAGPFCRHAAALLLHAIRAPASFAEAFPEDLARLKANADERASEGETPVEQLVHALEVETLARLREIAKRLGFSIRAHGKAEMVRQLAEMMADPGYVDRVLASLPREDGLVLHVVHLLEAAHPPNEAEIAGAYHALGGTGTPSISALAERGLVMTANRPGGGPGYALPRAVSSRLGMMEITAKSAKAEGPAVPSDGRPDDPSTPLRMDELIAVMAGEIEEREFRRRLLEPVQSQLSAYLPRGWRTDPADAGAEHPRFSAYEQSRVRLLPERPVMGDGDLQFVALRTGQPELRIAFALRLMAQRGILVGESYLVVNQDRLYELLDLDPLERQRALVEAWLGTLPTTEMEMIFGSKGPMRLTYNLGRYGGDPRMIPAAEARHLVARCVGQLRPRVWYRLEALEVLASALDPSLLKGASHRGGYDSYWISEGGGHAEDGSKDSPVLESLRHRFVRAELEGPLSWLGMVEVAQGKDGALLFAVRPEAGLLAGRAVEGSEHDPQPRIAVDPDLAVLVPAGTSDLGVYARLGSAGVLEGATPAGMRYRLTLESVQGLFDSGVTGQELIEFLAEGSGSDLPAQVVDTIGGWWSGYGSCRLYDDLTLIELADDYLLPELLATTSLRSSLLHTFSPRLIAISSDRVEAIIDEMTRLGHAPKLVEE